MKKAMIILTAMFAASAASAGNNNNNNHEQPISVEQDQGQEQMQAQVQEQSQEQDQSQQVDVDVATETNATGGNAEAVGGNASVNFEAKKNTPNIFSGYIAPSDPCMGGANGAVSVPGFGLGGGKTTINADCERREWFRVMMQSGHSEIAMKIWCASPYSHEAGMEFCADYRTAPTGWDASEKVEVRDYSQFNSEKKFTTEEADERCKRQGIVCDQNK